MMFQSRLNHRVRNCPGHNRTCNRFLSWTTATLPAAIGLLASIAQAQTPTQPTPAATPASTLTLSATVASKAPEPSSATDVGRAIEEILEGQQVTVRVLVSPDAKFTAVITGKIPDEAHRKLIQNIISNRKVVPNLVGEVIYRFTGGETESTKEQETAKKRETKAGIDSAEGRLVTEIWPLTFSPEKVHGNQANGATDSEAVERYRIDSLVEALNERYGKKDAPVVRATRNALVIRAPIRTVLEIKRDLVKLDAPGPQVQLDTWAIQISGKGDEIGVAVQEIHQKLAQSRQWMQIIQSDISRVIRDDEQLITRLYGPQSTPAGRYPNLDALDHIYSLQQEALALRKALNRSDVSQEAINNEIQDITEAIPTLIAMIAVVDAELKQTPTNSVEHDHLTQKRERLETRQKDYRQRLPKLRNLGEQLDESAKLQRKARNLIKIDGKSVENNSEDWINLQLLHQLSRTAQFDIEPRRNLSLTEVFIFLAMTRMEDRETFFNNLDERAKLGGYAKALQASKSAADQSKTKKNIVSFPRLRAVFVPSEEDQQNKTSPWRPESYKVTIGNFLLALKRYKALDQALASDEVGDPLSPRRRQAPEMLAQQAAAIDGFLALAVEALSEDVQDLLLKPLVNDIKEVGLKHRLVGKGKGTALLGRTRLVVTSGLESGLAPTLTATVNVSTPAPLTVDELMKSTGGEAGLRSVFEHLSTPQLGVLGTLLKETPPIYADIAPGVGLNVRPTVMPDGSHARLQLNARFGIGTKFPGKPEGRDDVTTTQPFDAVQSHHVSTDAIINGLDLFGISSFDIETRTPRTPFVTPVLGRIPLLGAMFRFPRNDTRLSHHSVILVNTVILPRTLDIVRFYGGGDLGEQSSANLFVSTVPRASDPTKMQIDTQLFIPAD